MYVTPPRLHAAIAAPRRSVSTDSDIMPLSMHMEGDTLCLSGLMEGTTPQSTQPKALPTKIGRADPFPQQLDNRPDHTVAALEQVPADSKPKLAESVGVLQSTTMSGGSRLF